MKSLYICPGLKENSNITKNQNISAKQVLKSHIIQTVYTISLAWKGS